LSLAGKTIAVTGATGFLGRHVVVALAAAGAKIRMLARSQPVHPTWRDLSPEVVVGSLSDREALFRLVDGADRVVHIAGLIKAIDANEFMRVNRDGSRLLAEVAAQRAPGAALTLISSLAAREPTLSGYGASKRAAEEAVFKVLGRGAVTVLRPPAIYGPGDRETLAFFKLGRWRRIPVLGHPDARVALVHVEDAARQIAAAVAASPTGCIHALADDQPKGYTWREVLTAAAISVGNSQPRFFDVPAGVTRMVGVTSGAVSALTRRATMVNPGKVRELLHRDWSVSDAEILTLNGMGARIGLQAGFASTAAWYRRARWLNF